MNPQCTLHVAYRRRAVLELRRPPLLAVGADGDLAGMWVDVAADVDVVLNLGCEAVSLRLTVERWGLFGAVKRLLFWLTLQNVARDASVNGQHTAPSAAATPGA